MNSTSPGDQRFAPPSIEAAEEAAMPYIPHESAAVPAATSERARRVLEQRLLADEAVTGIILDRDEIGEPCILVYVRDPAAMARIPAAVDGVRVIAQVGEFDAHSSLESGA